MLLIARTSEALSQEECDLRDLIRACPRTAPRPTDQPSGELTGSAFEAFAAPCITEEADIPFSAVPNDAPLSCPPLLNDLTPAPGAPSMHIKHLHQGSSLIHLTITDLALLALVLRHAADNEHLLRLGPLMPLALDSLASAFESATLVGLHQTGHLRLEAEASLTAEALQAWCQRLVAGELPDRPAPLYSIGPLDRDNPAEV